MKNTWIGDSGASCHTTNNDTSLQDITNIDESIQVSSGIMPATKKGKLGVKVRQVNGSEQVHTLQPVKFCPKVGANLFSLMCKLLQGSKISSDNKTTLWSTHLPAISFWIARLKLVTVGLLELTFFETLMMKGQYLPQPCPRRMSMTSTSS